jgi:hypothetical protein
MEEFIEEEIMKKHNEADAFISLFFAFLDALYYISIIFIFGYEFKSFNHPKEKISFLIIIDAVLRIIRIYSDNYSKRWLKEFLFSFITTGQFYIVFNCLDQIITKTNENLEIKNKGILSCIFFFLAFDFKGLFPYYKIITTLQYILAIFSIILFSKHMIEKLNKFMSNFNGKLNFSGRFINVFPPFITLYFLVNSCGELAGLLVSNLLYSSYLEMLCQIFKEGGKYLVFILLIMLFDSSNKYLKNDEKEYKGNPKSEKPKKNKVKVYKDEDEIDED